MNDKHRRAAIVISAILGCMALLYLGGLFSQILSNYAQWVQAGGMMGQT